MIENNTIFDPEPINPQQSDHIHKGWVSDDDQIFWIEIPKNASKSVSAFCLHSNKWREAKMTDPDIVNYHKMIVLRDPIDRWLKSSLELVFHAWEHAGGQQTWNESNLSNLNEWFNRRNFVRALDDIHLWRQTRYLHGLNIDKCKFIHIKSGIADPMEKILGYPVRLRHENATHDNEIKEMFRERVKSFLDDPDNVDHLRDYYAPDYNLLEYLDQHNLIYR